MRPFGSAKALAVLLSIILLPAARPAAIPFHGRSMIVDVEKSSARGGPSPSSSSRATSNAASASASASPSANSNPKSSGPTTEVQGGLTGVLMTLPDQIADAGLKRIPDDQHPFIAPKPDDQRGPCPAMNVLANHGYIPRNGIATFEELTTGMMEGFNMEVHFAAGLSALNFVSRGNAFANKISIGGESILVPPLPGNIDGNVTGGIAKSGRFEGDASMSRIDANLGDNKNFVQSKFNLNLLQLGKFGDDGPDGNNTVVNVKTLVAMEKTLFELDQKQNPKFEFPARRMFAAYGQTAFLMAVFANGTTNATTLPILDAFFRNETFPENWFRAAVPITGGTNAKISSQIAAAIPTKPGRNNDKGEYVEDPEPPAPFNSSLPCAGYLDQANSTPAVLQNTTGIFKKNVDFLTGILFAAAKVNPGCTQFAPPSGPANV
ncbi:Cloroperoxidase [Favolaschia claudopus]|uniref:Cloroperoxidase n=1 Tax=Favolaschia claudopus TaxID=2862362 RepID=A0AAW0BQA3_9AGAR